jgi:hypothetical protein
MRELTPSLLAAQRAASAVPYIKVAVHDTSFGTANLRFTRLYTGAEPDYFHAAAMPADGSLIRARITPPADSRRLLYQRVSDPAKGSAFSQWSDSGQYDCVVTAAASLGAEVSLFWIRSDRRIQRIRSTDCGDTWGNPELIDYTVSAAINGIGAAYKPNGDLAVFFADQSTLYVKQRIGGTWGVRTAWDKTTGDLSGVSCVYDGGWCLFLTGKDSSGNFKLWSLTLSDSGVWPALEEIATSPAASNYEFRHASLAKPDVFRCFYVEKYSGESAYSRPYSTRTVAGSGFGDGLWRESQPFDLASDYGLDLVSRGDDVWLCSPGGVWKASLQGQLLDLSAEVVSVELDTSPTIGTLDVAINNAARRYSTSSPPLAPGGELTFTPGFITAQGPESGPARSFQLMASEHDVSEDSYALTLFAADGWAALTDWRPRHTLRWNRSSQQKNVVQMLAFVLARVGMRLEVYSQSGTAAGFYPDFTVDPATDGKAAVEKLLSFVPDLLFIDGSDAYLLYPQFGDPPCCAYETARDIIAARYRTAVPKRNSVSVEGRNPSDGSAIICESFDWDVIGCGPEVRASVIDPRIASSAQAAARGQAMLRKDTIHTIRGWIVAPANCGLQLYDVISVTDTRVGLAGVSCRVTDLQTRVDARKGTYRQRITLGGV